MREPILSRSGLINEQLLSFSLPHNFSHEANYKGVNKYKRVSDRWDSYDLNPVREYLLRHYSGRCRSRMASLKSVVADTEGDTSCGFPMNQKFRLKREFFNSCLEEEMSRYDQFVDDSAVGECIALWNSFSKNEALKLTKILSGELRQISGSDARFNLSIGRFSKNFNDAYIKNYRDGHSRAGVPIQHGGWHWLFGKHSQRGRFKKAIEIDIKKHDSTMARCLMLLVFYVRRCAMVGLTALQQTRWFKLVLAVIDAYFVLPDGVVVRKSGGNCSGNFDTLVLNTMIMEIYLLVVWIEACRLCDQSLDLLALDEMTVTSLCGDDGLQSIDPSMESWYTPQLIVKILADFGVEAEARVVDLTDAQFLSHQFRYYQPGRCVVPYPVNCHKAVANVLSPPTRYVKNPNYPMLLARVLAQRNRFFADAVDPVSSYWQLFDSIAELYRPLAAVDRLRYPEDYATAMALDQPHQIVAELYCLPLERVSDERLAALSNGMLRGGFGPLAAFVDLGD
jgi:hypothetical protein